MLHALPAAERERRRGAARVLDLPAVEPALGEALRVVAAEAGLLEERALDARLGRARELAEVERDVDAREEGLVEGRDAVRSEE